MGHQTTMAMLVITRGYQFYGDSIEMSLEFHGDYLDFMGFFHGIMMFIGVSWGYHRMAVSWNMSGV